MLGKTAFCRILKRWFISWIKGQKVQKLQILLFFASYIARILKILYLNSWPYTCYRCIFSFPSSVSMSPLGSLRTVTRLAVLCSFLVGGVSAETKALWCHGSDTDLLDITNSTRSLHDTEDFTAAIVRRYGDADTCTLSMEGMISAKIKIYLNKIIKI